MNADDERRYVEYVSGRLAWLRKVAYLLCQDWHRADDLAQAAITRLYVHWRTASRADNLDGYARRVLVREFLSASRTVWASRVTLYAEPVGGAGPPDDDPVTRVVVRAALAEVPPRQRAALVLRYYCDLSVEESADKDFTYLGWEYAPQAWAYVDVWIHVPGVDTRDFVRALARRVAENVRYGVNERVRLPFATTGVPAQWPVSGVEVCRGDDEWSTWVTYDDGETGRGALAIGVDAGTRDWWNSGSGEPNMSIDGRPARFFTDPGGGSILVVYPVEGLFVSLSTTSTALLGGLEGVFRATEFYPDPADWR